METLTIHLHHFPQGTGNLAEKESEMISGFSSRLAPTNLNTCHCNATKPRIFGLHNRVLLGPKKKCWLNRKINGSGEEWDSMINMIKTVYKFSKT